MQWQTNKNISNQNDIKIILSKRERERKREKRKYVLQKYMIFYRGTATWSSSLSVLLSLSKTSLFTLSGSKSSCALGFFLCSYTLGGTYFPQMVLIAHCVLLNLLVHIRGIQTDVLFHVMFNRCFCASWDQISQFPVVVQCGLLSSIV